MSALGATRRRLRAGFLPGMAPTAAPALVVVAVGFVLAVSHGGYSAAVWYPAGLFLTGLLVVVGVLAPPGRWERSRLAEGTLLAYGLFTAWTYLAITWADSRGLAWEGANRTLLYGIVLALVILRPWPPNALTALLGVVVAGLSVMAIAVLVVAAASGDLEGLLLGRRLAAPTGYANATPALWMIGFWPALWLACAPPVAWPLRGLALAAAGVLVETALVSQSRGGVGAFVVVAIVFVALVPRRWPALLALGATILATVLASQSLLAVHDASSLSQAREALDLARDAVLVSALGLALLGMIGAILDRAASARLTGRRAIARAGNWGLVALLALAVAAGVVSTGNPKAWASARWDDFKQSGYTTVNSQTTRFGGSLGSQRYDFYRVALDEFERHPVTGIGLDNFGAPYLLHRRSYESPRYAHSLAFMLLAETGVVGSVLFLAFLVAALSSAATAARRAPPLELGLVVAAVTGFAAFFVHGLVDWLWQFPALGILAFALLGAGARAVGTEPASDGVPERDDAPTAVRYPRAPRVASRLLVVGATLAVALSFALPGIATRYVDAAYSRSPRQPELALARLQRAAELNSLSPDPLLAEAIIARRLGRYQQSRDALREAIERDRNGWFSYFELALLDGASGRRTQAQADLDHARRLNPRQQVITILGDQLARGEPIDADALEARLSSQQDRDRSPTG